MSDLLIILFTFLTTLLSAYLGWYAREWTLRHRTPEQVATGDKRCGICQKALPVTAMKSAFGQWRCADHKSVA